MRGDDFARGSDAVAFCAPGCGGGAIALASPFVLVLFAPPVQPDSLGDYKGAVADCTGGGGAIASRPRGQGRLLMQLRDRRAV